MNTRRFAAELSAIVVSAALCAAVSNLAAGRERRMAAIGRYPGALTLPQPGPATAPVASPAAPAPAAEPSTLPDRPTGGVPPAVPPPSIRPAPAVPSAPAERPASTPASRPPGPAAASAPAAAAPSGRAELLSRFPAHPDRPFVEISGADALWAHGRSVAFLDARRTKVYEEGHVAGARSFPVWESDVDQRVFAFQDEAARDLPVVLYCSGGECEDSHMLADKLFGAGFENVLVYRDGWPDWVKRGGPVRTGPLP